MKIPQKLIDLDQRIIRKRDWDKQAYDLSVSLADKDIETEFLEMSLWSFSLLSVFIF